MRSVRRCVLLTRTCRRRCRATARKVAVTASAGFQYTDTLSTQGGDANNLVKTPIHGANPPRSVGATITQTLFNGQQTANRTRAAEGQVSGAREALRALRADRLAQCRHDLHGLSARFRDRRGAEEQRSRARADAETDRATASMSAKSRAPTLRSRRRSLPPARRQLLTAEANLTRTRSNFRRIIGNEPEALAPGSPVDRFLPSTLPAAVDSA
jgi:outer membrane protein